MVTHVSEIARQRVSPLVSGVRAGLSGLRRVRVVSVLPFPLELAKRNIFVRSIDNPQVQGIIVAIPKGGSDKYGVSNPQGTKGKINILSSPICH